jgi:flavodoxin
MKLIIVVHTKTGRTAELARKIAEIFRNAGHEIDIAMLRTVGKVTPGTTNFEIKNPPEINNHDAIIFAGPVWGFKASPVIMKYIGSLKDLKNKKIVNVVTKSLPFNWTGGNQALAMMKNEVESANGHVIRGEIVQSFSKASTEKLNAIAENIFSAFSQA